MVYWIFKQRSLSKSC